MMLKKIFKFVRNLICAFGLILISPFLFFAALMVIIEDGMPVFFIQERVGVNNTIFQIIKIRTLKMEAPNTGTHHLDKKYQLMCGKIFRKIKLDEFPQLINVLIGDINLIGPRPGLTSQKELTKYRSANGVYEIKPGITGLSQVLGYDMSDPLKLAEIDKLYIKNKSIYMDFLILLGTFVRFPRNYLIKLIT